jgi:hypothetical protein
MDLSQLAFAAYIYRSVAGEYDKSLIAIRTKIGQTPDLSRNETASAILQCLNEWNCRLCEADFGEAALELAKWQHACGKLLPPVSTGLLEMRDADLKCAAEAYAGLLDRKTDRRRSFGPTATAKVLFFIRPNALPPWDEAIRKNEKRKYNGRVESYLRFLQDSQSQLFELRKSCEGAGVDVCRVPEICDRPASTLAKLVDEYNWVTITRKWEAPDTEKVRQWLSWSDVPSHEPTSQPVNQLTSQPVNEER